MNAQPELLPPVTPPPPSVAERTVERQGLEWLAPLFKAGHTKPLMMPQEAANAMQASARHVYELIGMGKLETTRVGADYRVSKRSLMVHLWEGWSGRHHATPNQITTFIVLLLGHLPVKALQTIAEACAHLIARKAAAEHSLGLNKAPAPNKRQRNTELPLD